MSVYLKKYQFYECKESCNTDVIHNIILYIYIQSNIYIYVCVFISIHILVFSRLVSVQSRLHLGVSPVAAPSWNPQTQRSTDAAIGQSNRLSKGPDSGMKFMS